MIYIIFTAILTGFNLGLVGPIIYWNKTYNIGDSLSHALIFSIVLAYFLELPEYTSLILVVIIFVLSSFLFETRNNNQNINMMIISNTMVAITLLIGSYYNLNEIIKNFLIGDIFSANTQDFFFSIITSIVLILLIKIFYKKIILLALSEELLHLENINVFKSKLILNMLIGLVVSISIQIIGILLITALLIIPATTARYTSKSPFEMLVKSVLYSMLSCFTSIFLSFEFDIAFSPLYILILVIIYIFVRAKSYLEFSR